VAILITYRKLKIDYLYIDSGAYHKVTYHKVLLYRVNNIGLLLQRYNWNGNFVGLIKRDNFFFFFIKQTCLKWQLI